MLDFGTGLPVATAMMSAGISFMEGEQQASFQASNLGFYLRYPARGSPALPSTTPWLTWCQLVVLQRDQSAEELCFCGINDIFVVTLHSSLEQLPFSSKPIVILETSSLSCTAEFRWIPLKLTLRWAHFIQRAHISPGRRLILKCLITLAPFLSWKMAELLPFQSFSTICLWAANAGHRAFAKWERAINRCTGSTDKKPPLRALTSEADPYLIVPGFSCRRRGENETRLPSWHWFIPLTVWCHCIVSPLNLLLLVLPGSKWSKTIPGRRCAIHISVVWGYIF